jgi:hypothetical protein
MSVFFPSMTEVFRNEKGNFILSIQKLIEFWKKAALFFIKRKKRNTHQHDI